jgi:hypothetical protein
VSKELERRPPSTHDHFVPKLMELAKKYPGESFEVNVSHSDWCDLLAKRGHCNCEPRVSRVDYLH